jgi:hypothetical protein
MERSWEWQGTYDSILQTAFLTGLSALPWLIKPLYGFFSDGVPLFGYRRRSYLVLCGLLGAFSWGSLASFVDNKFAATTVILLSSLSVAFADVVSFITNCFCSMLWLLVLWYHLLAPAQFGISPDFFERFLSPVPSTTLIPPP